MSLAADLKVLYHLTVSPVRGRTHAERLESFYGKQAAAYDSFRKHLLPGREELCGALSVPPGGVWIDLGAGTGENAEFFGEKLASLSRAYLVDLSPGLLTIARRRIADRGWSRVETVEADATEFRPQEPAVDLVTFSYSLTMIPDWFAAVERAYQMLRPGGLIGVVDFYVGRKYPAAGHVRHGWLTRTAWPAWFGMDNVFLSSEHLPYLERRFETLQLRERRTRIKYLPVGRVPYYLFAGRKPVEA